ncbi:MAG: 4Fe-4S dicluster domain-containing protein [Gracilibacteraceae bacterium]|jgi:ferredoxin like protein|nr:4Fe-4S dicluster domain-containing protein [Gracilibacteraceae bacterium]
MSKNPWGTVAERLDRNRYETDTEQPHILVDQEEAARAGAGPLLARICPAGVYSEQTDGGVGVLYAACLECGTCLAAAPPGVLSWSYPRGGMGVIFREG